MNRLFYARLKSFALITLIFSATGCGGEYAPTQISSSVPATPSSSPVANLIPTVKPSPTPNLTVTPVDTKPIWEIMGDWTLANRTRTVLVDYFGDLWMGGPAGIVQWDLKTNTPTAYSIRGDPENANVVALSQTPDGAIWAGTFGNGLAKFDGKNWTSFTIQDGVPGNFIVSQTVTSQGELWFSAQKDQYPQGCYGCRQDAYNFVRFDGNSWNIEFNISLSHLVTLPDDSIIGVYNDERSGLTYSRIRIYDGQRWNTLGVYPDGWVSAITVAPDGVMWLATDNTVYRYENHTWQEITPPWAGKDFTSVSSIAVSTAGVVWFGFSHHIAFDIDPCGDRAGYDNERGAYRYDGKTWTHFTTEDGLIDNKICAISIDANDNVWFGSFDKGVSRFDGETWTSYVIP